MPLAEFITVEVGSAIAKSILRLWLKKSTLGEEISSNLIDLLKAKTSDVLAQKRGERQFDIIGEKVGESITPLFELEGAHLSENSRRAVAIAVAEAFNRSKLSSELLAERNLEPSKLAKHVLDAHPSATQLFSEAEVSFYRYIINISCIYIVDIASQLPSFTEYTFAEVLKREDQILARALQILQEVRQLREQLNPLEETGRFEIDYCLSVTRNLDVLQLIGLDTSSVKRRYRLSVAYITLAAKQNSLSFSKNKSHGNTLTTKASEGLLDEIGRNTISVDQVLAGTRCLLIRGPAGSGKTTLLQWIAVRSATRTFEEPLTGWNDKIPFYIRLRNHVQRSLPNPEEFPGLVAFAISATTPKGWVESVLKSGRAIVLVDGIDEVPLLRREDVRIWLKDLVGAYPSAIVIITSRPHAVEDNWLDHKEFSVADLQSMALPDIYKFIDHWHKALREDLQDGEEKAELESLAEHLKEEVKDNRSLRNLAINPLLCAMICSLNQERNRQLPADRIELYDACCSLLIERRDKVRSIQLTDYPILNFRQKIFLLQDLAYWMLRNNQSETLVQYVDERFTRNLANMQGISSEVSGRYVRQFFVERTGIIREPVKGHIDFTHRTFQEFLAARSAADEMDTGLLVANAHSDQWREVIILTSGLAAEPMREEIIKSLIARGDREKSYRYQLHLLAVSCLETSVKLRQELRMEVEKRISKLVPPKDMEDAKSFAAAGDLVVKYLNKRNDSAAIAAICVRTLAYIASKAALDMIENYNNDDRQVVIDELIKAWDFFDRDEYAKRILTRTFRNVSDLRLENLPSLKGFQYFTKLTSLTLNDCSLVNDLSPLAGLTKLTSLSLRSCKHVSSLSPLENLHQLTSLNLSFCEAVNDLSPLAGLTKLTNLSLSATQVNDLSPLSTLTQLTQLYLSYCREFNDLSPLTSLKQLVTLDLSHCIQLRDISALEEIKSLKQLGLVEISYLVTVPESMKGRVRVY